MNLHVVIFRWDTQHISTESNESNVERYFFVQPLSALSIRMSLDCKEDISWSTS